MKDVINISANAEESNLYSCQDCDLVFSDQVTLKTHREHHHQEEALAARSSDEVNDELITEVELLLEDDSIFKKKNLISCELCPSAFPSQSRLNEHMLKHTGERPFKCPLCSKSYPVKGISVHSVIVC